MDDCVKYDSHRDVVIFYIMDAERRIECEISGEKLEDDFRAVGGCDEQRRLDVHLSKRPAIEATARKKIMSSSDKIFIYS